MKIDPQDLSNAIAEALDNEKGLQFLVDKFDLPEPNTEQTMVITLHIPVTNMNAMGDTYTMAVKELTELFGWVEDPNDLFIHTVDIIPRSIS